MLALKANFNILIFQGLIQSLVIISVYKYSGQQLSALHFSLLYLFCAVILTRLKYYDIADLDILSHHRPRMLSMSNQYKTAVLLKKQSQPQQVLVLGSQLPMEDSHCTSHARSKTLGEETREKKSSPGLLSRCMVLLRASQEHVSVRQYG